MSKYINYLLSWLKSKENNVIQSLLLFLFRYCKRKWHFSQCVATSDFSIHSPFLKGATNCATQICIFVVAKR